MTMLHSLHVMKYANQRENAPFLFLNPDAVMSHCDTENRQTHTCNGEKDIAISGKRVRVNRCHPE